MYELAEFKKPSNIITVDLVDLEEFVDGWRLCDYSTPAESSDDESE